MSDHHSEPSGPFGGLLTRSVRLGRPFGVEVRLYVLAAVLLPLLFLHWFQPIAATGLERIALSAFAFLALYTIVWTHEMGHVAMARRFHIQTPLITLSPIGGLAHLGARVPTPRIDLWVTLAGPAVHLVWLAVLWPIRRWAPYDLVLVEGWNTAPFGYGVEFLFDLNQALLLFNLLPLFPMDGGRSLRALLAMRMDAGRATIITTNIGLAGAVVMGLYGFSVEAASGMFYVWLAFTNAQACLRERMEARSYAVYDSGARRRAFESDPDAWRTGADPFGASDAPHEPAPGPFGRWKTRRAAGEAERTQQREVDLDRQVDEVLARVHAVGMNGLTDAERDVLRRASERRRTGR